MAMKNNDWQNALQGLLDGGTLPEGEEPAPQPATPKPEKLGKLSVSIERKGRAGKTATIISGFTVSQERLEEIAATLKQKLGTGGSARGGEILIQGDRRNEVVELLKLCGGAT